MLGEIPFVVFCVNAIEGPKPHEMGERAHQLDWVWPTQPYERALFTPLAGFAARASPQSGI